MKTAERLDELNKEYYQQVIKGITFNNRWWDWPIKNVYDFIRKISYC